MSDSNGNGNGVATIGKPKPGKKASSWSDNPARTPNDAEHADAMGQTKKGAKPTGLSIVLPPLDIRHLSVRIVGDSGLIVHKWSEKAKKQMLDKQMGIATEGKDPKNPERDYQDSMYVIEAAKAGKPFEAGRFGFPAIAFKNSGVTACTSLGKAVTKVMARQAFHVVGELVEIVGTPEMREDMVTIGQGTADIRYRGWFPEWSCDLRLRYNARVLSAEQVVNLINIAGFAVGVGEWRPETGGAFGMFHVG